MGIGANPLGIWTLVSTLMPLVTSRVVERPANGGGAVLGAFGSRARRKAYGSQRKNHDEERPEHPKTVVY